MFNETDTVYMAPLDNGSACREYLYLIHSIHKRDLNGGPTEFEPAIPINERTKYIPWTL